MTNLNDHFSNISNPNQKAKETPKILSQKPTNQTVSYTKT
jgi:hypothetical protein